MDDGAYALQLFVAEPYFLFPTIVALVTFFYPTAYDPFFLSELADNSRLAEFICKYFCRIKVLIYFLPAVVTAVVREKFLLLPLFAVCLVVPLFENWVFLLFSLLIAVYLATPSSTARLSFLFITVVIFCLNQDKFVDTGTCPYTPALVSYCRNHSQPIHTYAYYRS